MQAAAARSQARLDGGVDIKATVDIPEQLGAAERAGAVAYAYAEPGLFQTGKLTE